MSGLKGFWTHPEYKTIVQDFGRWERFYRRVDQVIEQKGRELLDEIDDMAEEALLDIEHKYQWDLLQLRIACGHYQTVTRYEVWNEPNGDEVLFNTLMASMDRWHALPNRDAWVRVDDARER